MPKVGKRRRICAVATLTASLLVIAAVPSALGQGIVPQKGKWSGLTVNQAVHDRPNLLQFTVAGKHRKVKGLYMRAPRCDGALTRYTPTASAPVNNGKVHLHTRIGYSDGFAEITFDARFSSKTQASGTVKVHAKYMDTPCNYTLTLTKAVALNH